MPPSIRPALMPRCRFGLQATYINCQSSRVQSTAVRGAQLLNTLPQQSSALGSRAGGSSSSQCISLRSCAGPVDSCSKTGSSPINCRAFSSSTSSSSLKKNNISRSAPDGQKPLQTTIPKEDTNGRWYFQLRERIGKCIIFGLSEAQLARAAELVADMSAEWETLVLHMDEYPTDHYGLRNHAVPWGDMDSFGHVNNVRYSRYAETSRMNWATGFANKDPANAEEWRSLITKESVGLILAEISIKFLSPIVYPDTINGYHKVIQLPDGDGKGDATSRSSMALGCVILSKKQRRIVAQITEKIVFYDYRTGKRTDAPEFARKVLERACSDAAGNKIEAALRIQQFRKEVERLERGSWKREDAVEDLGSAAGGGR